MPIWEQKRKIIKHENLFSHIKMGKEIFAFDAIEIEQHKFYCYKMPFFKGCKYSEGI